MSGFVRPAPWLRRLFTPSQTAPVNPIEVSDDVSLIQPYDGGGYPLFDPSQWSSEVVSVAGAAATTVLYTVGAESVVRLLAAAGILSAGVVGSLHLRVEAGAISLAISPNVATPAVEQVNLPLQCPVIGPGHIISGRHFGGGAATVVTWRLYLVEAPLGTVFRV